MIFLKKEKKTDWYKTGIVQSSAKYSCNEMPLYFIDGADNKSNGKMMLNGKMDDRSEERGVFTRRSSDLSSYLQ